MFQNWLEGGSKGLIFNMIVYSYFLHLLTLKELNMLRIFEGSSETFDYQFDVDDCTQLHTG